MSTTDQTATNTDAKEPVVADATQNEKPKKAEKVALTKGDEEVKAEVGSEEYEAAVNDGFTHPVTLTKEGFEDQVVTKPSTYYFSLVQSYGWSEAGE